MSYLFKYTIQLYYGKLSQFKEILPATKKSWGYITAEMKHLQGGSIPTKVYSVDLGEPHSIAHNPREMRFWGYEAHDGSPTSLRKQEELIKEVQKSFKRKVVTSLRKAISDVGLLTFDDDCKNIEGTLLNQLNLIVPEEESFNFKNDSEDDFIDCE